MATIFQKVSGQALILEPREPLVYPFNLGDYTEIRMGGFFSMVGTGQENNNLKNTDETISSQSSILTQLSYGFTYITGADHIPSLPRSDSSFFIGNLSNTGNSLNLEYGNTRIKDSTSTLSTAFSTGTVTINTQQGPNSFAIPNQPSGDTSYAAFNSIKLSISNNIYRIEKATTTNNETNVSVGYLRGLILNQSYSSSNSITGFYTNDGTSSGTALNKPNAIYIYSPFLNNRLRVHTLLVERYS